jgi:hypothetical protein
LDSLEFEVIEKKAENLKGNEPLGRPRHRWELLEVHLKGIACKCVADGFG